MKYQTADGSDQDSVVDPILDVEARMRSLQVQYKELSADFNREVAKHQAMTNSLTPIQENALDGARIVRKLTPVRYSMGGA